MEIVRFGRNFIGSGIGARLSHQGKEITIRIADVLKFHDRGDVPANYINDIIAARSGDKEAFRRLQSPLLNCLEDCAGRLSNIVNSTSTLNDANLQIVRFMLDEIENMRVKCDEQSPAEPPDANRLICTLQAKASRLRSFLPQKDMPEEIADQLHKIEKATGQLIFCQYKIEPFTTKPGDEYDSKRHQVYGELPKGQGQLVIATTVEPGYKLQETGFLLIPELVTVDMSYRTL